MRGNPHFIAHAASCFLLWHAAIIELHQWEQTCPPTPNLWDTMGFSMVPGCECSRFCRVLPHTSCAFLIESEINVHILFSNLTTSHTLIWYILRFRTACAVPHFLSSYDRTAWLEQMPHYTVGLLTPSFAGSHSRKIIRCKELTRRAECTGWPAKRTHKNVREQLNI